MPIIPPSSLVTPPKSQSAEVEYSPIKIIIFGALLVAASLIFGYTLRGFILAPALGSLIYFGLALIGFAAIFALQVVFIKGLQVGALVILLSVLAFTSFFYKSISLILVLTALVAFLLLLQAIGSGQAEIRNVLKISFLRVAKPVIFKGATALALFGVVLFVLSINLTNVELSKKMLDFVLSPAGPITARFMGMPDFSFDKSLREILVARLPKELTALPTALKNQAIDEAAQRLEEEITNLVKITLEPTDTLKDIAYKATFGKLFTFSKTAQNFILAALGLILFLLVRSVLFVLNYLAMLIAYLLYEILFLAGFFYVSLESRPKEIIVLK